MLRILFVSRSAAAKASLISNPLIFKFIYED